MGLLNQVNIVTEYWGRDIWTGACTRVHETRDGQKAKSYPRSEFFFIKHFLLVGQIILYVKP